MDFISSWPFWLVVPIEVATVVCLAVLGHVVVRRTVPHSHLAKHNDVTGFVLAIVGVIYAVLLAFVVVVAWEGFNNAERTVRDEVSAASDLYRVVANLPAAQRREMRRSILAYAASVQKSDWPAMETSHESPEARDLAEHILEFAVKLADADTGPHRVSSEAAVSLARSLLDARRQRLSINEEGLPAALWSGLILGAAITIAFTYLFGVENFRLQLVMTALLAALIAVMFSMIVVLDYPFRGETSVSPLPWKVMVDRITAEHMLP